MKQLINKLNEEHNFHLSLKVVLFSEDNLLNQVYDKLVSLNYKCQKIDCNNRYESLKKAYDEKVDYVLASSEETYLLPLLVVISNEDIEGVKPLIPTLYMLKDNKIISKLKTKCNKLSSSYSQIRSIEEIIEKLA